MRRARPVEASCFLLLQRVIPLVLCQPSHSSPEDLRTFRIIMQIAMPIRLRGQRRSTKLGLKDSTSEASIGLQLRFSHPTALQHYPSPLLDVCYVSNGISFQQDQFGALAAEAL